MLGNGHPSSVSPETLSKLVSLTLTQGTKHVPVTWAQTEDPVRGCQEGGMGAACTLQGGTWSFSAFPGSLLPHWRLFPVEDQGCSAVAAHSLPQVSHLYRSSGMWEVLPDGEQGTGKGKLVAAYGDVVSPKPTKTCRLPWTHNSPQTAESRFLASRMSQNRECSQVLACGTVVYAPTKLHFESVFLQCKL